MTSKLNWKFGHNKQGYPKSILRRPTEIQIIYQVSRMFEKYSFSSIMSHHHDFASLKFPDLDTNIISNKKNSFYRFAKYILWDYSSTCFRNPLSFTNGE